MACRIQNLGAQDMTVDLRAGSLHVGAFQTSPPLREELLYDNVHLAALIKAGTVRLLEAKMSDVLKAEGKAAGGDAAPEKKLDETSKSAGKSAAKKKA